MIGSAIRRAIVRALVVGSCIGLAGCTSISGYPANPYDSAGDLATFVANSGPAAIQFYYEASPFDRTEIRNRIIYSRLAAYDIEYQNFQSDLVKEANLGNLSADLIVLGLNQASAVSGGVALKSALSAASGGIVGAKASVNKDLFFDRAVPALLAQMSAARTNQLAVIQSGLLMPDARYPLPSALMDVNAYREAGSIPTAITLLAANASAARTDAKETLLAGKLDAPVVQSRALASGRPASRALAAPFVAEAVPVARAAVVVPQQDPRSFFRNLP